MSFLGVHVSVADQLILPDALLAMEALACVEVPLAAQSLRAIALELERLSNHVGDLGPSAMTSVTYPGLRGSAGSAANFLTCSCSFQETGSGEASCEQAESGLASPRPKEGISFPVSPLQSAISKRSQL